MNRYDYQIAVIADDRESKAEVLKFLSDMGNVSIRVKRLSVGDYIIDDQLIFERKTLKDFAQSIVDGRLFRQAIRLVSSKYRSVLILEGTSKDLKGIGVRREAMQGALITISLLLGIPVLRSKDALESAKLILYSARQIKLIGKKVPHRSGSKPHGKRKKQLFILQSLPGIGSERAAKLLNAFGSVEAIVTATSEELQSVAGIGENIAKGITYAVKEQVHPYGLIEEFPI